METHPRFISFEGVDGAGKTTQVKKLAAYIEQLDGAGSVVCSKDPGGTEQTQDIRNRVKYDANLSPEEAAELIFLGRFYDLEFSILPALNAGKWVISDRFMDGSFTYQFLQGVPEDTLQAMMAEYAPHKPGATYLLDMNPEEGLRRKQEAEQGNTLETDVFENLDVDFHHAARGRFLELACREPARFHVISATPATEDEIWQEVKAGFDLYRARIERENELTSAHDDFSDRTR